MKAILYVLLILAPVYSYADNFKPIFSANMGMVNNSVTETESGIEGSSGAESVASSNIALDITYEFKTFAKRSYYMKAVTPIMSTGSSSYFMGGAGVNFYLSSLASMFSYQDEGTSIVIGPKLRYYWGVGLGVANIVYTTSSAKKSDVALDLELHAGGIYNIGKAWGLRGEFGMSRATGVNSTSINMKVFLGTSIYANVFESIFDYIF